MPERVQQSKHFPEAQTTGRVIVIFVVGAAVFSLLEWVKHLILPDLDPLQSHIVTMIIGIAAAIIIAQVMLHNRELLHQKIIVESRAHDRMQKTVRELQDSVAFLRTILESTVDGVLVLDAQWKLVSYNGKFTSMWGIPESNLVVGKDDRSMDLIVKQLTDQNILLWRISDIYAQPRAESFDVLELKDGRFFECFSLPQILHGEIVGRVWTFRDVTERERMEQALWHSDTQFREVWNSSSDGMRLVNNVGIILDVNAAFTRLVEMKREDLVGKPMSVTYAQHDREHILERHQTRFERHEIEPKIERDLELWNGNEVWFELSNSYIEVEGSSTILLSVFRNITERKRAEDALKQSMRKMRHTLESISDAFFSLDEKYIITYFNRAAENILGRQRDDAVGKYLFNVFPDLQKTVFEDRFREVMGQKKSLAFEVYLEVPSLMNWYEVRVYPQPEGISVYFQVITERKRFEQEREKLISELKEALARVKTLDGLVPICANCKRIRDDKGYWNQLEKYIMDHSDATLSHGICPECAKKLYPQFYTEISEKPVAKKPS